jgi:hypothetical protein
MYVTGIFFKIKFLVVVRGKEKDRGWIISKYIAFVYKDGTMKSIESCRLMGYLGRG